MQFEQLRKIQVLFELIIPLIGYFFWGWNTSFILIYYFLDAVAFVLASYFKLKKRTSFSSSNDEKQLSKMIVIFQISSVSLATLFGVFSLIHLIPNYSLLNQISAFFFYKELGIAQGYLLLPLVFFSAWSTYKNQFVKLKLFEIFTINQLFPYFRSSAFLLTGISFLLCLISLFFRFPSEVLLFSCIIGTTLFRWFRRSY